MANEYFYDHIENTVFNVTFKVSLVHKFSFFIIIVIVIIYNFRF